MKVMLTFFFLLLVLVYRRRLFKSVTMPIVLYSLLLNLHKNFMFKKKMLIFQKLCNKLGAIKREGHSGSVLVSWVHIVDMMSREKVAR